MAKIGELDAVKLYRQVTMHITIRRMPEARLRFRIAVALCRLAARIVGAGGIEFHYAIAPKDGE